MLSTRTGVPRSWETAPPLGPYSRTTYRPLWWSQSGGAVSCVRGTPVCVHNVRLSNESSGERRVSRPHPFEDTLLAGSAAILCTGGLHVIRKEAWSFYRTISGVRLCWELEEPEGPKGRSRHCLNATSPVRHEVSCLSQDSLERIPLHPKVPLVPRYPHRWVST